MVHTGPNEVIVDAGAGGQRPIGQPTLFTINHPAVLATARSIVAADAGGSMVPPPSSMSPS